MVPGVPPGVGAGDAWPGDDRPGLAGAAQPSSERSDGSPEPSGPLRAERSTVS